jgi:HEAT repeat protein
MKLSCVQLVAVAVISIGALAGDVTAQLDSQKVAADALKTLAEGVDDHDEEAVREALTDFDVAWPELDEKTRGKVVKAVGKMFAKYKPRDSIQDDLTSDRSEIENCYRIATGLMFDKQGGAEVLVTALKHKHIQKWPAVQAHMLEGLGHRRDGERIEDIAEYLEAGDSKVAAAAAKALGRLSEQQREVREEAVEALIEAYLSAEKRAVKEAKTDEDGPENEYYIRIEVSFSDALTALTRKRLETAKDWDHWYRKDSRREAW